MPTKYTQDDSVHALRQSKRTPYLSQMPKRRLSQRGRLMVIYAGVGALLLVIAMGQYMGTRFDYLGQPVRRGVGEGTGKEIRNPAGAGETWWLRIRVPLGEGVYAEDTAKIGREHWEMFQRGDHVAVLYQRANARNAVRIHECGLVALPAPE